MLIRKEGEKRGERGDTRQKKDDTRRGQIDEPEEVMANMMIPGRRMVVVEEYLWSDIAKLGTEF